MISPIYPIYDNTDRDSTATPDDATQAHAYSNSSTAQNSSIEIPDPLSIAVISPDTRRREAVCLALRQFRSARVREFSWYPLNLDELPTMLSDGYDVVVIDLDSALDYALNIVERISAKGDSTVMVYSGEATSDKLMRSLRAGAREFLTIPLAERILEEALIRASSRRPPTQLKKQTAGSLLTFMGSKGGVGVTTLACNFAVALAQESRKKTVLIDFAIPLGDVALSLGIQSQFSTVDALQAADRLDSSFLATLVTTHVSGLAILPAPGKFVSYQFTNAAMSKVLAVARQYFDYVVVDAGSRVGMADIAAYSAASTIYLVTQVGVAELRNSNRLISQLFTSPTPRVEIVLNRYDPRSVKVTEEYIAKILTRSPSWKIPNDFASVQKMQIDATPFVPGNSPIACIIQSMADRVMGTSAPEKKKKRFSLFRSGS